MLRKYYQTLYLDQTDSKYPFFYLLYNLKLQGKSIINIEESKNFKKIINKTSLFNVKLFKVRILLGVN